MKPTGLQKHHQNSTRKLPGEGRKSENCGGEGGKGETSGSPVEGGGGARRVGASKGGQRMASRVLGSSLQGASLQVFRVLGFGFCGEENQGAPSEPSRTRPSRDIEKAFAAAQANNPCQRLRVIDTIRCDPLPSQKLATPPPLPKKVSLRRPLPPMSMTIDLPQCQEQRRGGGGAQQNVSLRGPALTKMREGGAGEGPPQKNCQSEGSRVDLPECQERRRALFLTLGKVKCHRHLGRGGGASD